MEHPDYFRIVAGSGGYFAVVDQDEKPVISGVDLRNEREALAAIQDLAKERGLILNVVKTRDGQIDRIEARRPAVNLYLTVSAEMDEMLDQLSRDLGVSKAMAVVKAITLLKVAAEAKREGKAFGVAASPEVLDTEIVGI